MSKNFYNCWRNFIWLILALVFTLINSLHVESKMAQAQVGNNAINRTKPQGYFGEIKQSIKNYGNGHILHYKSRPEPNPYSFGENNHKFSSSPSTTRRRERSAGFYGRCEESECGQNYRHCPHGCIFNSYFCGARGSGVTYDECCC